MEEGEYKAFDVLSAMIAVAEKMGVGFREVDFSHTDIVMSANFIEATIDYTSKYEDRVECWKHLPEEVAHWWFKLLKNTDIRIELEKSYRELCKQGLVFENEEKYNGFIDYDLQEEHIGQLIAKCIELIGLERNHGGIPDGVISSCSEFMESVCEEYSLLKDTPFYEIANKIIDNDLSDLMSIGEFRAVQGYFVFEDTGYDKEFVDRLSRSIRRKCGKTRVNEIRLIQEVLASNNDSSRLASRFISDDDVERIPSLVSLESFISKYEKNGISLSSPVKVDGAKKIENDIYNAVREQMRSSMDFIGRKTVSTKEFMVSLEDYLRDNYKMTFNTLPDKWSTYRIRQTFRDSTARHRKIGLWFNDEIASGYCHFPTNPYSFGSIVFFKNKSGKEAAVIHEIQSDFFESTQALLENTRMDNTIASRLVDKEHVLGNISLLQNQSECVPKTFRILLESMGDNAECSPREGILKYLRNYNCTRDPFTLKNCLTIDEAINALIERLYKKIEDDRKAIFEEQSKMYPSQSQLNRKFYRLNFLDCFETKDFIRDNLPFDYDLIDWDDSMELNLRNTAYKVIHDNMTRSKNIYVFPDDKTRDRIIDMILPIMEDHSLLNLNLNDFVVQKNGHYYTIRGIHLGRRKPSSLKQLHFLINRRIRLDHEEICKLSIEVRKRSIKSSYRQLSSLRFLKELSHIPESKLASIIDDYKNRRMESISSTYDDLMKDRSGLSGPVKLTQGDEYLYTHYSSILTHHLLQTIIMEKGRDFPVYFPSYDMTMNLQNYKPTAALYAGPEDLKDESKHLTNIGPMYKMISSLPGVKLEYVKKIPGLVGDVGGYKLDLSNYRFQSPVLYAMRGNNVRIGSDDDHNKAMYEFFVKKNGLDMFPWEELSLQDRTRLIDIISGDAGDNLKQDHNSLSIHHRRH